MIAEILLAVRRPVLKEFVLRTAGTIKGTFVRSDPSPTCFAYTVPADIVEKKP